MGSRKSPQGKKEGTLIKTDKWPQQKELTGPGQECAPCFSDRKQVSKAGVPLRFSRLPYFSPLFSDTDRQLLIEVIGWTAYFLIFVLSHPEDLWNSKQEPNKSQIRIQQMTVTSFQWSKRCKCLCKIWSYRLLRIYTYQSPGVSALSSVNLFLHQV